MGKRGRALCSLVRTGGLATRRYLEPEALPHFGLIRPHVTAPFLVASRVLAIARLRQEAVCLMRTKWPRDMLGTDVLHSTRL